MKNPAMNFKLSLVEKKYEMKVNDSRLPDYCMGGSFLVANMTTSLGAREVSGVVVDPEGNTREIVKRWNAYNDHIAIIESLVNKIQAVAVESDDIGIALSLGKIAGEASRKLTEASENV